MPKKIYMYLMLLCITVWEAKVIHNAHVVSAEGLSAENSMRCNNKVISLGDSKAKVLVSCGRPFLKDTVTANGQAGEVVVQWTYNFGRGTFFRILSFRDGKLILDVQVFSPIKIVNVLLN